MLPENSHNPEQPSDPEQQEVESAMISPQSNPADSIYEQQPNIEQTYDDYPFAQKRVIGGWTDDDIASISLSGCLSVIFLSVLWTIIYIANTVNADITETSGRVVQQFDNVFLIGSLFISFVGFMGSAYFLGIRNHPRKWQSVGFKSVSIKWIIAAVAIGILFMPINIGVTVTITEVLDLSALMTVEQSDDPNAENSGELFSEDSTPTELVLLFLFAAILIPIAEEVFFRGILYRWLRVRAGFWLGLGISSVVFGSLHLGPQVISISILGAIMAVTYERSKSLWTPITIHATNNALAIILTITGLLNDLSV